MPRLQVDVELELHERLRATLFKVRKIHQRNPDEAAEMVRIYKSKGEAGVREYVKSRDVGRPLAQMPGLVSALLDRALRDVEGLSAQEIESRLARVPEAGVPSSAHSQGRKKAPMREDSPSHDRKRKVKVTSFPMLGEDEGGSRRKAS